MKDALLKQNGDLPNDSLIKVLMSLFLYNFICILEFHVSFIGFRTSKTIWHLVMYDYFLLKQMNIKGDTVRLKHLRLKCSLCHFIC